MEYLNIFIENFVPIIASILGTVLLVLVKGLIGKYAKKLDVETQGRLENLLSDLTQQGVAYAEQWAKNRNKQGAKVPSNEKLHKAMEYIAAQIRKHKLNELAETELREKIEAMLGYNTLADVAAEDLVAFNDEGDYEDEAWN